MEQISIYNPERIDGLEELIATIDCDLEESDQYLIVVNTSKIAVDAELEPAMIEAIRTGQKIIVIWPLGGAEWPLPKILRQVRSALIRFDAQSLHEVICGKINRNDGASGDRLPAPKTDRHCC